MSRTRCGAPGGARARGGAPRGNRNARKHGRYSAAALARRRRIRQRWREGTLTATLAARAHRLARGEGVEIALRLGRGGAVVPLYLWRDRAGLCHLSRAKPPAVSGSDAAAVRGRMGLFRENDGRGEAGDSGEPGRRPQRDDRPPHPPAPALRGAAGKTGMGLFRENGDATAAPRDGAGLPAGPRDTRRPPRPNLRGPDSRPEFGPDSGPDSGPASGLAALLCTTALHRVPAIAPPGAGARKGRPSPARRAGLFRENGTAGDDVAGRRRFRPSRDRPS